MIIYGVQLIALIVMGLLLYAPSFHYDFVFDDHIFIVGNPFIKNFSNFHLMWHNFPLTRLLGMVSFALNYRFNQLNPFGYHLFNFIVHLSATVLVWALANLLFKICQIKGDKTLSFIIAVIFLVHPCQTQAVTYIAQRFESMATFFYLATVYCYLKGRLSTDLRKQIIYFILAAISTVLGVMTKEVMITVPLMILAVEWILLPSKKDQKIYMTVLIAGLLVSILFLSVVKERLWVFVSTNISESHDGDVLTPGRYYLTQLRVFLTFMRLMVLPIHQNLDYDYPASHGLFSPPLTLVGLLVIGGIVYLIVRLRRSQPLIAFGLAWLLITFLINLVPRANVIFEHKLYLISFGFILSSVSALSLLIKNRSTLLRILGCLILILGIVTFERNRVWANELLLWQDSIKNSPNKARVNASLGRIYGSMGQYDQAIYYLSRSINIAPDNITYENRGVIYGEKGDYIKALDDLNHSIAMDPQYPNPYIKRSWVYQTQHHYGQAFDDLNHAISLEPYFPDAYLERGTLWLSLGRNQEARADFQTTLKIDPYNSQANFFLKKIDGQK